MALNSSGPLSIAGATTGESIEKEFQGTTTNQLGMSQLYRGGGLVPNSSLNTGVPTSGAIAIGNFYGAANRVPVSLTISSATQNYNIYNNRGASYVAGSTDLTLTVNAVVGSSSTGSFALTVGSFATGDTVTIINNSYIVGCGGNGGSGVPFGNGNAGAAAGPALNANRAVTIYNYGVIGGGGGGGGASGGTIYPSGYGFVNDSGRGGGGGAGNTIGYAGSGASNGSLTAGGGGQGGFYASPTGYPIYMAAGGAGGSQGAAGAGGGNSYSTYTAATKYGGAGGGAGACTSGNSNITWAVTGTRNGALN